MKVAEFPEMAGPLVIDHPCFDDSRGRFTIPWNDAAFAAAGFTRPFRQDNIVRSKHGVLRGLHYQAPTMQGKLVTVLSGAIFDVAVDMRRNSPTFGNWVSLTLSSDTARGFWIPRGFAHGYQTLTDDTLVLYKVDGPYAPSEEICIRWNDPDLAIDWPIPAPVVSGKDAEGIPFAHAPACETGT